MWPVLFKIIDFFGMIQSSAAFYVLSISNSHDNNENAINTQTPGGTGIAGGRILV